MKSEIVMCNYYGMCDASGKSIGHSLKVTEEYSDLLKGMYHIKLAASPCIERYAAKDNFHSTQSLKYDIDIMKNGLFKRITDKFKLLYNIHQAIGREGVYFFYQVDFFFFFYVWAFYRKKKNRKLACLIYHQDFTGGRLANLLQAIYRKAISKIDGVLYTQTDKVIQHRNAVWIPDYFYDAKLYERYQKEEKGNTVVCMGTMNRYKQLEEVVRVFAKMDMPLVIAGKFDDEQRADLLRKNKSENIQIINRALPYEEYMGMMASAKYSIMPYDMGQYKNRTSGVLLESIYMGCIPIAPAELLEQNKLPGIGYKVMEELTAINWMQTDEIYRQYEAIYAKNDKQAVLANINELFKHL